MEHPVPVRLILFSKDRPWQLKQCLESLHAAASSACSCALTCSVIFTCSSEHQEAYGQLEHSSPVVHSPALTVHFVREGDDGFANTYRSHFATVSEDFVMLTVDDALWLDLSPLHDAVTALQRSAAVIGCLLKLHPGVAYSHPSDTLCCPPKLHSLTPSLLQWQAVADGTVCCPGDWGYPICLASGLYRRADLDTLLSLSLSLSLPCPPWRAPNTLEVALNEAWRAWQGKGSRLLCPLHPCLLIPTWGSVQADLGRGNRVFSPPTAMPTPTQGQASLEREWYRTQDWCSAHIGALALSSEGGMGVDTPLGGLPAISILLPVHNGAGTVGRALASVAAAAALYHGPLHVCVVDDGSGDDSCSVVQAWAEAWMQAHTHAYHLSAMVLSLGQNVGVACALNIGWASCTAAQEGREACKYVCRVDADDECDPRRFLAQVQAMEGQEREGVAVLGTAVRVVEDSPVQGGVPSCVLQLPRHAALSLWEAWFGSPVAHPSVCMRVSAFPCRPTPRHLEAEQEEAMVHGVSYLYSTGSGGGSGPSVRTVSLPLHGPGPYPTRYPHAEDYALWMACIHTEGEEGPGRRAAGVYSLGDTLTTLHKSGKGVSARAGLAQAASALALRHAHVAAHVRAGRVGSGMPAHVLGWLQSVEVVAYATCKIEEAESVLRAHASLYPTPPATQGEPTSPVPALATACLLLCLLASWTTGRMREEYGAACEAAGRGEVYGGGTPIPLPAPYALPPGHGVSLHALEAHVLRDAQGRRSALAVHAMTSGAQGGAELYTAVRMGGRSCESSVRQLLPLLGVPSEGQEAGAMRKRTSGVAQTLAALLG